MLWNTASVAAMKDLQGRIHFYLSAEDVFGNKYWDFDSVLESGELAVDVIKAMSKELELRDGN
jgi:hypothetical protein